MNKLALILVLGLVAVGCGLDEGDKSPAPDNDNVADGGTPTIVIDHVVVENADVDVENANVDVENVDVNVKNADVDVEHAHVEVADAGTPDSGTDAGSDAGPTTECGDDICEGEEDDLNCPSDCVPPAPAPAPAAAPFKVNGKYAFGFSVDYISGSLCGETRVFYGPMQNADLADRDTSTGAYDGYLSTTMPNLAAGEYRMSYVDDACPGETVGAQNNNWADYGDMSDMIHMDATARSFLYCTQYNASSNSCSVVSNPGCEIRFNISSDGTITGAGNMTNLTSSAAGCF